jgi:uncharacterized protein (DUF111 family)
MVGNTLSVAVNRRKERRMKNILVYDIEADEIEKIADENDMSIAEIIEMLMDYAEDMKRDNGLVRDL